jgi:hypothetical protein
VEYIMEAKKVWQGAMASVLLSFKLETGDMFQYSEGRLYSDYVCK